MLVVASDRLGTINHTLLTLGRLEVAGLDVRGLVLSAPMEPDHSTGRNAAAISRLSRFRRIITLPRETDPRLACAHVMPVVGWLERKHEPVAP